MIVLIEIFFIILMALWLGTMALIVVLTIKPDCVRLVRRLVCRKGAEMIVEPGMKDARSPNERTIGVVCVHPDGERHDVKMRALFFLWGVFTAASLPAAAIVVIWIGGLFLRAWG